MGGNLPASLGDLPAVAMSPLRLTSAAPPNSCTTELLHHGPRRPVRGECLRGGPKIQQDSRWHGQPITLERHLVPGGLPSGDADGRSVPMAPDWAEWALSCAMSTG